MAKSKKNNSKLILIAFCLIFFIAGAASIYLLIVKTNYIPINYQNKYFQIYDSKKTPTTDVYIDLVRGFEFNYSPLYAVESFSPNKINREDLAYLILVLSRGSSKIEINSLTPVGDMPTLMEYAKRKNFSFFEQVNNGWKYSEGTVDGKEAVFSEFEMTEEIYNALPDEIPGKGDGRVPMIPNRIKEEQKVGYVEKAVFIKRGNLIYIISSNSFDDPPRQKAFDTVINSFKFLF